MIYFIAFFGILFFMSILRDSPISKTNTYKKMYIFIVFIGIFLLIGLRDISVGTDTITYVYTFLGLEKINWTGLRNFINENPEPLYTLLIDFCKRVTDNYTVFLLIFAFPISIGFTLYIKDYSEDYFLSVILFIVLGIMGFCMAGLRQSVAIGITLIGYKYARERRLIPFLVCCILAFGFHNSSIICFFVYFLNFIKKINFRQWIAVVIAFILGYMKSGIVLKVANIFFLGDRFDSYGNEEASTLNYTMFFIQLLFLLFCYLNKNVVLEEDENNAFLYSMAFIGVIFQSFTPIVGEFFRLSLYFSVSLCILVPKVICSIKEDKFKTASYIAISGVSLTYLFVSDGILSSYIPFWK